MYLVYHTDSEAQEGSYLAQSKRKFEEAKRKKGIDSRADEIRAELGAQTRMSWEKLNQEVM